jgi:hypothetical protein
MTDRKEPAALNETQAESHSPETPSADYWPNFDDFETVAEYGEFCNALAVLEGIGRRDELVRFLLSAHKRGASLSPGVAKVLAYIIGGGELRSGNPDDPRTFVFAVKEQKAAHRPADSAKDDRHWGAAVEVLRRVKAGEKFTKALKDVRAKHKINLNELLALVHAFKKTGFRP